MRVNLNLKIKMTSLQLIAYHNAVALNSRGASLLEQNRVREARRVLREALACMRIVMADHEAFSLSFDATLDLEAEVLITPTPSLPTETDTPLRIALVHQRLPNVQDVAVATSVVLYNAALASSLLSTASRTSDQGGVFFGRSLRLYELAYAVLCNEQGFDPRLTGTARELTIFILESWHGTLSRRGHFRDARAVFEMLQALEGDHFWVNILFESDPNGAAAA